jgi:hypothetical protein
MQAGGNAVDGDVEADSARPDKLEGIGISPRIERSERRRPAPAALLEQEQRGGVDDALIRRMRLGAEAPEIGVNEAGVHRPDRELPAAQKRPQERQVGLRPDNHGVVELL